MAEIENLIVIGAGQMGRALAAGFCRDGGITAADLVVYDPVEAARNLIAEALPGIRFAATAAEAARHGPKARRWKDALICCLAAKHVWLLS